MALKVTHCHVPFPRFFRVLLVIVSECYWSQTIFILDALFNACWILGQKTFNEIFKRFPLDSWVRKSL